MVETPHQGEFLNSERRCSMMFTVTEVLLPALLVNIAWADKYETKLHGWDSTMIIEDFAIKYPAQKLPTKSEIV